MRGDSGWKKGMGQEQIEHRWENGKETSEGTVAAMGIHQYLGSLLCLGFPDSLHRHHRGRAGRREDRKS